MHLDCLQPASPDLEISRQATCVAAAHYRGFQTKCSCAMHGLGMGHSCSRKIS